MQTSKISRQISSLPNDHSQEGVTTYDRLSQAQGGVVFAGQVLTDPHRRGKRGRKTFEGRVINTRHHRLDSAIAEYAALNADISRSIDINQKHIDDRESIRRGIDVLESTGQISRRMAANVRDWLEA
jgi:5S rRNA maturation endonuclease (ribonuclease M5)